MAGFRQASIIHDLASRDHSWCWVQFRKRMMSKQYPDWVDPWKAAEGSRMFSGTMPLERMPRLLPLLASPEGEAEFTVAFAFDKQTRVTIQIEVEARLPLICQRSLEPYLEPIKRRSLLGVVESLTEEAQMAENYEAVLVQQGRLALADLVEDELLLGLPQVPRNPEYHEGDLPVEKVEESSPGFRKPFANLGDQWKGMDHEKSK